LTTKFYIRLNFMDEPITSLGIHPYSNYYISTKELKDFDANSFDVAVKNLLNSDLDISNDGGVKYWGYEITHSRKDVEKILETLKATLASMEILKGKKWQNVNVGGDN